MATSLLAKDLGATGSSPQATVTGFKTAPSGLSSGATANSYTSAVSASQRSASSSASDSAGPTLGPKAWSIGSGLAVMMVSFLA
jgi:hypothetical protein